MNNRSWRCWKEPRQRNGYKTSPLRLVISASLYPPFWAIPSHSEPLWATLSHSEPLWALLSHAEPLWAILSHSEPFWTGVTASRATSRERRKDRNTSGQRGNKFNTSFRYISVVVAENNSVVKPKCYQYTSLNKMLSNFSKVLMAHISFTVVSNNVDIGKGIGGIRKCIKKNYIYVL